MNLWFFYLQLGWFANPIFSKKGGYPSVMVKEIAKNSEREGRISSRLPTFSKRWIDTIRGSADFLGLNYYTSRYAKTPPQPPDEIPSFERDQNVQYVTKPEWKHTKPDWLYSVPSGLGDILRWNSSLDWRKILASINIFFFQMDKKRIQ